MTLTDLSNLLARELGPQTAARAVVALCREAAGERLYIPRHPAPPEILPSDTVSSIRARYSISRRTAYHWIAARRAPAAVATEEPR